MNYSKRTITLVLLTLSFTTIITLISCTRERNALCIETEKQALLTFKQSLIDPDDFLSSWKNNDSKDCCAWERVVCDKSTGHVRELDLRGPDPTNPQLGGEINPSLLNLKHLVVLDLSQNNFTGSKIPSFIGSLASLEDLDLSSSGFQGMVPQSFANLSSLRTLDLSGNNFHAEIPSFIGTLASLEDLDLSSSGFQGMVPHSFANLSSLHSLKLYDNALSGQIPDSVQNCTALIEVDLSRNKLAGHIPSWIGTSLSILTILILRSNNFSGGISPDICKLPNLHILDLGDNRISGAIPRCLNNLTAISSKVDSYSIFYYLKFIAEMSDSSSLTPKRIEREDGTILSQFKAFSSIDLSNNQLSGTIPKELTSLAGLISLNLSGNHLSGLIPDNIGDMKSLESLDFSKNHLSGEIPITLTRLTYLEYLNLSYNDFSGRIPQSTQLLNYLGIPFSLSSYIGNDQLCGSPLSNKCDGDDDANTIIPSSSMNKNADDIKGSEFDMWFYVCMSYGFVVGFWVWWATLIFKKTWR